MPPCPHPGMPACRREEGWPLSCSPADDGGSEVNKYKEIEQCRYAGMAALRCAGRPAWRKGGSYNLLTRHMRVCIRASFVNAQGAGDRESHSDTGEQGRRWEDHDDPDGGDDRSDRTSVVWGKRGSG